MYRSIQYFNNVNIFEFLKCCSADYIVSHNYELLTKFFSNNLQLTCSEKGFYNSLTSINKNTLFILDAVS